MAVEPLDLSKLRVLPLAAARQPDARRRDPGRSGGGPAGLPRGRGRCGGRCGRGDPRGEGTGRRGHPDLRRHLLRNGAARILERMMAGGWLTHLATNGAGTIHDWEYAWLGASTE